MAWKTRVQYQIGSYQRLKKWYLLPPCLTLSIIGYRLRVSGTIERQELHPLLHVGIVAIEKGDFSSPSTTVGQLTYFNSVVIF